ncbi:MAG: Uma2 family endonuclease [Myxococcota bacterium]
MASTAFRRATLDDLLKAEAEGLACEIVGGELVRKAMADDEHGAAQWALAGSLDPDFGRRGGGRRPGGWWLRTEVDVFFDPDHVLRPDASGWRRDRVPEMPREFPVRIAPDWVCEILSPSTAGRDLGVKRDVYHRGNVGHYWVIDRAHRLLEVYVRGERAYELVLAAGDAETVRAPPFDAVPLFVGRLFGIDPPDED